MVVGKLLEASTATQVTFGAHECVQWIPLVTSFHVICDMHGVQHPTYFTYSPGGARGLAARTAQPSSRELPVTLREVGQVLEPMHAPHFWEACECVR